jgi:tripartite-type tricarboxylate transporter receptor subunit TctC
MRVSLGQPIIVENATGAGGTIGVGRAVRAAPDGYTLSLGQNGSHVITGATYPNLPYNLMTDFEPVSLLVISPFVITATKATPANNLKELVAYLKANPGRTVGNAGMGSITHVAGLVFQSVTGTQLQFVPYRGTGPAMQDLIGGRIDFLCDIAVTAVPAIKGGTVKGLATLAGRRMAVLPDMPTAAESGLPTLRAYTWTALFAPKGTPAPIVEKLNAATVAAMNGPSLKEQLDELAAALVTPERRTPAYLTGFVKAEWDKWGAAIRAGGAIPK